jgi:hypothetical protein
MKEANQLGIAAAVDRLQLDHHGRVDQHHKVIEGVRPVEKADGDAPPRQAEERAHSGKRLGGGHVGGHLVDPDSREALLIAASSSGTYAPFCKAARRRPCRMSYQPIACRIADLAVGLWPSLIPTGSACPHALRFFAQ